MEPIETLTRGLDIARGVLHECQWQNNYAAWTAKQRHDLEFARTLLHSLLLEFDFNAKLQTSVEMFVAEVDKLRKDDSISTLEAAKQFNDLWAKYCNARLAPL